MRAAGCGPQTFSGNSAAFSAAAPVCCRMHRDDFAKYREVTFAEHLVEVQAAEKPAFKLHLVLNLIEINVDPVEPGVRPA